MSILKLLFLACALTLVNLSTCLALCPPDMEYFAHTRSCFQFYKQYTNTFYVCRSKCRNIRGAENNEEKGHMAWILDSETDNFLKGRIDDWSGYWIGLNDGETKGVYKWSDRRNQVTYYGWKDGRNPPLGDVRGVILYKDGWMKHDRSSPEYCLCEVKAATPQVTMSSPLPLQVGKKGDQAIRCSFNGPWTDVSLYLPRSKTEVVRCTRLTSGRPDCRIYTVTGYIPRIRGDSGVSVDISDVKRHDGGEWTCGVKYDQSTSIQQTQEVKVFEIPTNIACNHTLSTTSLQVECVTPRIFPKAVCRWYSKQDGQDFQEVTIMQGDASTKEEEYTDDEGANFWKSTCILVLRKGGLPFRRGTLTLRVAMDPDIEGMDDIEDYTSTQDETVSIVKPNLPKFKHKNKTRTGDSITLIEGQQIQLVCFVYHGTPKVEATTLRCDFPFNVDKKNPESVQTEVTLPSVSVSVTISANKDMNGKTCDCRGHHLTGTTEITPLGFNIEYPASIVSFFSTTDKRTKQNLYTYEPGESIDIMCRVDGNPTPDVTIRQAGAGQELNTNKGQGVVSHRLTTKCSDNGQYICQAKNVVSGNRTTVNESFRMGVRCYPTVCPDRDFNMTVGANIGDMAKTQFCMNAYPEPTPSLFEIHSTNTNTPINKDDYSLQYTSHTNGMDVLSVDYAMETDKMFGSYEVLYQRRVVGSFQIVLKGAPFCPDRVTVQSIGVHEMLLEWNRPLSHKMNESFVIFDVSGSPQELKEIVVQGVAGEGVMAYNMTGLEHDTMYNLTVGTRNGHGHRVCLSNRFNATTEGLNRYEKKTDSGSDKNIWIIIGAVAALVLVIIVVIIVFVVLFRRKRKQSGSTPVSEKPKNTTDSNDDDIENADDQMVYAKVNKKSKGPNKGKATGYPDTGNASTIGEEHIYSNDFDGAGYASGAVGADGATASDNRELVYISVSIGENNKVTLNKGEQSPKPPQRYEPVEYSSIDTLATKHNE